MAAATVTDAQVRHIVTAITIAPTVTLTLTEDEAIGLKTLLNFVHVPNGVAGAANVQRVADAIDSIFAALSCAGVPCSYREE